VNQHRDSAASYIGHENLLDYFALVENESKARVKFTLLEVTECPITCGIHSKDSKKNTTISHLYCMSFESQSFSIISVFVFRKCCSRVVILLKDQKRLSVVFT
jgi:splicing factor 3B subunit 5